MREAILFRILVIVVALAATACGTKRLSEGSRQQIRRVAIDSNVAVPESPDVGDPSAGFLGLIVLIVSEIEANRTAAKVSEAMKNHQVDLGALFLEDFTQELTRAALFELSDEQSSDATFSLEVQSFGFQRPPGFTSKRKPMLMVSGTLTSRDGEALWKGREALTSLSSDTTAYPIHEYIGEPGKLRAAFEQASEIVARGLVEHLTGR